MNAETSPPAKLFLALDGKPQGPHTAAEVMKWWREGTIKDDTLICPDGGAAWVTVKEFEPALRAELPPIQPAVYGAAAAGQGASGGAASPSAGPQVGVVKVEGGTKGLRIGSLVAALIMFFLPWLELRCQGPMGNDHRLIYQSGVQTVINQFSEDDSFKQMTEAAGGSRKIESTDTGDKGGYALFAGAALLALLIALAAAIGHSGRRVSGLMAAIALALLGLEAVVGFPMERAVKKELPPWLSFPGTGSPAEETPDLELLRGGTEIVRVKYAPWFYAELAALGLAAFLGLRR